MSKMIGIKATVTMNRVAYIEVPDDSSEEDIIKIANQKILPPQNALAIAYNTLKRARLQINDIDLKDWEVTNYNLEQID